MGDIVVSNINAVHGAVAVIPQGMEQFLISTEYTILRLKDGLDVDAHYLWSVLRSAAVVAEWLSHSSGVGRHRVGWEILKTQQVPLLPYQRQREIGDMYREAQIHREQVAGLIQTAADCISGLDLDGAAARDRLARAKPPQ